MYRFIILTSIQSLQYERSVTAVYYLLQGKQSIQSIQDANLFGLHPFYSIYKSLSKRTFMQEIEALTKNEYIQPAAEENFYTVTDKGCKWIEQHVSARSNLYFNGMEYRQIDEVFFARILLLVQVWTNSVKKERNYIPIIDDVEIEKWTKVIYQRTKDRVPTYLQALYDELIGLFESVHAPFVEIFLLQLSSYHHIGMSAAQLAHTYERSIEDIHLITTNIIHFMLAHVNNNDEQYPVLSFIGQDLMKPMTLTKSAHITNEFLNKGWTIEAIATQRRLKINTIYDHIVEIAMQHADFPLEEYVTKEQQREITKAIERTKSYTLKEIKTMVDESVSYFQIRLVLALTNTVNV